MENSISTFGEFGIKLGCTFGGVHGDCDDAMKPLRVLGSGGELHHGGRGAFFHEGVSAVKRGA
jgi:hypothetical protein